MRIVDRHLWRRFWDIAVPYWRQNEKWKARGLLVLLVLLLLGQTGFAVLFNEQTGEFTSALAARDSDRFWTAIRWCLALVAGAVPIYALYYFVRDTLGNHWRRWLTNRFLASYFRDRNFYELNTSATIDQLQREADFRFSLVRVREKAEAIALYRGEAQELRQVRQRFGRAFDNFSQLIRRQLFLNLFQYAYSMLTIVLPSALIASRVLSGELEVGRAIQAAGAFAAVLSAISVIIENFEGLSRFAAGIDRLDTFLGLLAGPPARRAHEQDVIESVEDPRLALERVTLQTPRRERTLVRELSITVQPGEGLMIVGASGSGKSSLLRAIGGLWYAGSGRILRPPEHDLVFLPQQPYMFSGSLRGQLLYPDVGRPVSDTRLLELLALVNLPELARRFGGLDAEMDWEKVLSIGEQQRLAFARVLRIQPRFAILDEATSALDAANEGNLYRQLAHTSTTLVSVGHRPTILQYHKRVLELTGDGQWRVHSAEDYRFGQ